MSGSPVRFPALFPAETGPVDPASGMENARGRSRQWVPAGQARFPPRCGRRQAPATGSTGHRRCRYRSTASQDSARTTFGWLDAATSTKRAIISRERPQRRPYPALFDLSIPCLTCFGSQARFRLISGLERTVPFGCAPRSPPSYSARRAIEHVGERDVCLDSGVSDLFQQAHVSSVSISLSRSGGL